MLKKIALRLIVILFSAALIAIFTQGSTIYEAKGRSVSDTLPVIYPLLDTPIFTGVITLITVYVFIYIIYLLWQLHEVAVHKAKRVDSAHLTLVFALTLCGLFIDSFWWVVAIIIAFTRWDIISNSLSKIIERGFNSGSSGVEK